MTSFSKRDPLKTGVAGILGIVLAILLALNFEQLPIIRGTTYQAHFSEAAGLRADNEVRIAGVKVGKVTDVELDGDKVLVTFRVNNAWLGDRTTAMIRIKTLLGQKYLALDPQGNEELSTDQPIPLERTMAPYDVIEAFSDLSTTVDQIDTGQLATSFRTLTDAFRGTPDDVRGALDGLSALSQTIAARDEQLDELLQHTSQLTETVAERNAELEKLLADGNLLLQEIRARRDSIHTLLQGTRDLSAQLTGLVEDNQDQLGPALEQLDRVTELLERNQENLDRSLQMFAPFTRLFANVTGNGHWFDSYICGLLPPTVGPINREGCHL